MEQQLRDEAASVVAGVDVEALRAENELLRASNAELKAYIEELNTPQIVELTPRFLDRLKTVVGSNGTLT